MVWRGFQVDGSTLPAVEATKERFRIYPLSRKDRAPEMKFLNVSAKCNNTIHRMNFGFWEELNAQIQAEPIAGLDPEIRGLLASIGIEKGKPFAPDTRMRAILTEAATIGSVTARALTARPQDQRHYLYPGEGVWTNPFIEGSYDFLLDGARLLDSRVYMHFYATGITPAMSVRNVGKGSQYAIAFLDRQGNVLDGSKTYRIHLPPNVPARDFWSFTLYDNQTRAMLQTDQRFPGLDNNRQGLQQNDDGSFDIYFGPQAPAGLENNWLQTVPGKGWNVIFRLYGPLQPFDDKTWRPGDPELIDNGRKGDYLRLRIKRGLYMNPGFKENLVAIIAGVLIIATVSSAAETLEISEENYAHAETARNFRNWVKLGANEGIVHMKQLPPRGRAAPTVQMNDDTLNSIVVTETEGGRVRFTVPEVDVFMSVQVVTEGGHGQHYVVGAGDYNLPVVMPR